MTYCCSDTIVLLQYISQACWVLCSPRLDFFHRTVISTLVAANSVTFGLNVRLDLSWEATTKSLSPLQTELLLQVLGKSTGTVAIRVIHGDEGVGDIPGVQGVSGGSVGSAQ